MARAKRETPKFSEAELCAKFIKWAAIHGWIAYPETGGFDFILVRDGVQIGFQAKLVLNLKLLQQILPGATNGSPVNEGPHYRAILVGEHCSEYSGLLDYLGISAYWMYYNHNTNGIGFAPRVIDVDTMMPWNNFGNPVVLPRYVPDMAAGAASPTKLTDWKIKALQITAILEIKGHVDLDDFRRFDIDFRRWTSMGWLQNQGGKLIRGSQLRFDEQHPIVYQTILEELRSEEGFAG